MKETKATIEKYNTAACVCVCEREREREGKEGRNDIDRPKNRPILKSLISILCKLLLSSIPQIQSTSLSHS